MGNEQSTSCEDDGTLLGGDVSLGRLGLHVLKIATDSPAQFAGLQPYFDFILSVNDRPFEENATEVFVTAVKNSVDARVRLTVFNALSRATRETDIVPQWWGEEKDGLIGCSIRCCSLRDAYANTWRVMKTYPNSPAADADLKPELDHIVASPECVYVEREDFYDDVQEHFDTGQPLRLYVFRQNEWTIREVRMNLRTGWKGHGLLGCELGSGALHRIPVEKGRSVTMLNGDTRDLKPISGPDADMQRVPFKAGPPVDRPFENSAQNAGYQQPSVEPIQAGECPVYPGVPIRHKSSDVSCAPSPRTPSGTEPGVLQKRNGLPSDRVVGNSNQHLTQPAASLSFPSNDTATVTSTIQPGCASSWSHPTQPRVEVQRPVPSDNSRRIHDRNPTTAVSNSVAPRAIDRGDDSRFHFGTKSDPPPFDEPISDIRRGDLSVGPVAESPKASPGGAENSAPETTQTNIIGLGEGIPALQTNGPARPPLPDFSPPKTLQGGLKFTNLYVEDPKTGFRRHQNSTGWPQIPSVHGATEDASGYSSGTGREPIHQCTSSMGFAPDMGTSSSGLIEGSHAGFPMPTAQISMTHPAPKSGSGLHFNPHSQVAELSATSAQTTSPLSNSQKSVPGFPELGVSRKVGVSGSSRSGTLSKKYGAKASLAGSSYVIPPATAFIPPMHIPEESRRYPDLPDLTSSGEIVDGSHPHAALANLAVGATVQVNDERSLDISYANVAESTLSRIAARVMPKPASETMASLDPEFDMPRQPLARDAGTAPQAYSPSLSNLLSSLATKIAPLPPEELISGKRDSHQGQRGAH